MNNNEIIATYPWLQYYENTTWLDMLPKGWHNLILDLSAQLKDKLIEHNILDKYHITDAKEKYYVLRWYDYLDDFEPMPSDIVDLVMDFESKSKHICMICGNVKEPDENICTKCTKDLYS